MGISRRARHRRHRHEGYFSLPLIFSSLRRRRARRDQEHRLRCHRAHTRDEHDVGLMPPTPPR